MARRKKWTKVDWEESSEIKKRVIKLVKLLGMDWIDTKSLYFVSSTNSSSRAYARIWGLSKVWQITLKQKPSYVIEVLSQRFDKLSEHEQNKVLLHELAHIPKNFSGSLLPHVKKRGKRNFHDRVNELFRQYKKSFLK